MSARTAPLHSPAELTLVTVDDTTGIVTFRTESQSNPAQPNHTAYDTATGATYCDCKGAECDRQCWHADHVAAAWLASPAMADVRWLTDRQLVRYGKTAAAMVATCGGPPSRPPRSPTPISPWRRSRPRGEHHELH